MREALAHADHDYVIAEPRRRSRRRGIVAEAAAAGRRLLDRAARYTSLVAGAALAAVILGIFINALALQKTRHPAPFFGRTVALPEAQAPQDSLSAPAPRPSVEATPAPPEAAPRVHAAEPAEAPARDPIAQLLKVAPPPRPVSAAKPDPSAKPESRVVPARADPIKAELAKSEPVKPEATKTVAAAQRALVKLGFVLRADGVMGASTHQALEQFERDRGLSVHGELTPQVIRELRAQSGVEIE